MKDSKECPVKEPCKRDSILQKRPVILRSLQIEATPYQGFEGMQRLLIPELSTTQKSPVKETYSAKETRILKSLLIVATPYYGFERMRNSLFMSFQIRKRAL